MKKNDIVFYGILAVCGFILIGAFGLIPVALAGNGTVASSDKN